MLLKEDFRAFILTFEMISAFSVKMCRKPSFLHGFTTFSVLVVENSGLNVAIVLFDIFEVGKGD